MDEFIKKSKVIELVMQYCPDDDGSCSKAGNDLRELLDEIEAIAPEFAAGKAERARGEWKISDVTDYRGRRTGEKAIVCDCGFYKTLPYNNFYLPRFCESCGAEMK